MFTSVKRRLFLIISVLCLVTMGGGGYLYARALASRHVYRTVPVTRGALASAVSATGNLNAVITVQVGSQVRTAADGAPRRGGGQPGRVWVMGDDGNPRPVAVQLGVSDGTRSEVLAGPLTEQSQVIISTGGPSDRNSRTGSEPRLRF
jgi:multidrug efflux pump subunit AcrA (membrane-fusion protein)